MTRSIPSRTAPRPPGPARRLVLPALVAALMTLGLPGCGPGTGPVERITVPRGAGFRAVADTLEARGLISSRAWLRVLASVRGQDRALKPGVYDLPRGSSAWAILDLLTRGEGVTVRVTVPEGLTLDETAALLASRLNLPAESLLAAAAQPGVLARLGPGIPDAEGFLAPETYTLPALVTPGEVIDAMVAQFLAGWDPAWDDSLAARGLTRLEAVTLASIVEGEARTDAERPVIAGVYLNRLRLGMPLQADPTIQYALQRSRGRRTARVLYKDLEIDSPWNTYRYRGLPPGPINSPGLRSLRAVMEPAEVPYLYFVADGDGKHVFSRSYQEHLRAVAQVRRGR